jgi:endonuclease G
MGILEQIAKAKHRLPGESAKAMVASVEGKTPAELATAQDQVARWSFLQDSLLDDERAKRVFERIIEGNELQDINYFSRGTRAARSVARIAVRDGSGRRRAWGTGFLIAPQVLITNNHVLPDAGLAGRSEAQFQFERDIDGLPLDPATFAFDPGRLFFTSPALDFSVVAVAPRALNAETALDAYGCLPLVGTTGKIAEGEWLTIVQHPNGDPKQVCVRENRYIKKTDDVIWYSTDTVGGSSGSPVFNNDWYVVALHHSGVPEEKDGRIQTIHGRAFDPQLDQDDDIKWIANEGMRVSRIVETLRQALPNHPMLQQVFDATAANARIPDPAPETGAQAAVVERATGGKKVAAFDVPFNATYDDRKGFEVDFLGGGTKRINLPRLSRALVKASAKLIKPVKGNTNVLHYHHQSVVMHAQRRFAIYSAASVSFAGRFEMSRPPDVWRVDPRIPIDTQVTNFYYAGNQFDRGHLTRREDLEFGRTPKDALIAAADTCHWTNCTPQHKGFNQNKELWQGIERHVLELAIVAGKFKAQVITGPVLDPNDPVYAPFPKIQYPARYWKVVAALTAAGKLFATAYILDQTDVIAEFGLKEGVPVPFTAYKTFQVPIAEVERITGLAFTFGGGRGTSLRKVDPLAGAIKKPSPATKKGFQEAAAAGAPNGYLLLDSLTAIEAP